MTEPFDETVLRGVWSRTLPPGDWDSLSASLTYRPEDAVTAQVPPSDVSASDPTRELAPELVLRDLVAREPGRYVLEGELGRGGMGVVFRARQKCLDRHVAVKRLIQGRLEKARFAQEAAVTASLEHPNIVSVHELATTEDGELFLAMKLVGGTSWRDLLHPRKPEHAKLAEGWTQERHLDVLLSVANAIEFAHARGIVHRDLKPENVMVGEFGEVLVMDWGLAVGFREGTPAPHRDTATAPAGSPAYMAPEQAEGRGQDLGPHTDVFLLGAILHEILTGEPPYKGNTLISVIRAASRCEPPRFGPGVPSELADIATRALSRDPAKRPSSVGELRTLLRGWLAHKESTKVAAAALAALEAARKETSRPARYAGMTEAVSGFRQALVLWSGNEAAREGEVRARSELARDAVSAGDLGLADAQACALDHGSLRASLEDEIARARTSVASTAASARRTRRALVGAGIALAVGVVVFACGALFSYFAVKRERDAAQLAQGEESRAKVRETKAREDETEARKVAEQERDAAREARAAAEASARETRSNLARFFVEKARASEERHDDASAERLLARALALDDRLETREALLAARVAAPRLVWTSPHRPEPRLVAISPDGKRLATGSTLVVDDVSIFLLETGALERTWRFPHADALAFSEDGSALAVAGSKSIGVLDLATGRSTSFAIRGLVHALAFSKGRIAAASTNGAFVLELSDGKIVPVGEPEAVRSVAFAGPNLLVGKRNGTAALLDLATGRLVRVFSGHKDVVSCVAAKEDAVASSGDDLRVRVFDLRTGAERFATEARKDLAVELRFFGGKLLAVWGDGLTQVLDATTGKELSRRELGVSSVSHAQATRDLGKVALSTLEAQARVVDLSSGELLRATGHSGTVTSIAASPDGKRLVSSASDGSLIEWDTASGRERPLMDAAGRAVFAPDGKLAVIARDSVRVLVDGRETARFPHPDVFASVAWSPDSSRIATITSGALVVHELGGGSRKLVDLPGAILSLSWGESGIAVSGLSLKIVDPDGTVRVSTGREAVGVSWIGSGTLAFTTGAGLEIWYDEASTSMPVPLAHQVHRIATHRNLIAMTDGTHAWVYDTAKNRETMIASRACEVAFLPDGRLATGAPDGSIRIFDLRRGMNLRRLELPEAANGVAFVANDRFVAARRDGLATLVSLDGTIVDLEAHADRCRSVSAGPEGRFATAGSDGTIALFGPRGERTGSLRGEKHPSREKTKVVAVAFSPDGKRLASASTDRWARVFSLERNEEVLAIAAVDSRALSLGEGLTGIAWDPRGHWIATGGADELVKLWDATTGEKLRELEGHDEDVQALAVSSDGRLLASASWDKTVRLWDTATWRCVAVLERHRKEIASVAFSQDGKRLASIDIAGVAVLWDVASRKALAALPPHAGWGSGVAFSPDGKLLATSSLDHTVRLWDVTIIEKHLTTSPDEIERDVERETGLRVDGLEPALAPGNRLVR